MTLFATMSKYFRLLLFKFPFSCEKRFPVVRFECSTRGRQKTQLFGKVQSVKRYEQERESFGIVNTCKKIDVASCSSSAPLITVKKYGFSRETFQRQLVFTSYIIAHTVLSHSLNICFSLSVLCVVRSIMHLQLHEQKGGQQKKESFSARINFYCSCISAHIP